MSRGAPVSAGPGDPGRHELDDVKDVYDEVTLEDKRRVIRTQPKVAGRD
jgi:hypothetical protein